VTDESFEISDEDRRLLELEAYAMMATAALRPTPPKQPSHPAEKKPEQPTSRVALYVFAGSGFIMGALVTVILMRRKRKKAHDDRRNT